MWGPPPPPRPLPLGPTTKYRTVPGLFSISLGPTLGLAGQGPCLSPGPTLPPMHTACRQPGHITQVCGACTLGRSPPKETVQTPLSARQEKIIEVKTERCVCHFLTCALVSLLWLQGSGTGWSSTCGPTSGQPGFVKRQMRTFMRTRVVSGSQGDPLILEEFAQNLRKFFCRCLGNCACMRKELWRFSKAPTPTPTPAPSVVLQAVLTGLEPDAPGGVRQVLHEAMTCTRNLIPTLHLTAT